MGNEARKSWQNSARRRAQIDIAAGAGNKGTMELGDLRREERVALVALVELVVESDPAVTEDEVDRVQAIIDEIGEAAYRDAVAEVDERFGDEEELRAFLRTITRQEARELIYEAALEAAIPDVIGSRESQLLEWLAKEWGVALRFEEPDTGP